MPTVDGPRGVDPALAVAAFDGAVDPTLVVSDDGTVLAANTAAAGILDQLAESGLELPPPPGTTTEVELHTPSGHRIVEARVGTATLGDDAVHVVTLRDLTERARVEHALRDFVSTASHEFRSPLAAILGFAETLDVQWDSLRDGDRLRYVATIQRQAQRLARLTEDLLTVTRLSGPGMETAPQSVSCRALVDGALRLVDLDVTVTLPDDLCVQVDPDHFEDILVNLLTNAGKYGAAPIEVTGTVVGDAVVLRVIDHGRGIPEDFQRHMFDQFSRDRRAAREHPGSGLGLSIVEGLVERNGGSVAYEDTPGGGATFVVRLPLAPS
jgi:signal transduction histidine kinase